MKHDAQFNGLTTTPFATDRLAADLGSALSSVHHRDHPQAPGQARPLTQAPGQARPLTLLVSGLVLAGWSLLATPARSAPPVQPAPANGSVVVIEQSLERPVDVTIPADTRLEDALKLTLGNTGVKVSIGTSTLGFLPDGLNTVVSGKLKGVRLRDGLSALLNPLGLTWQPREKDVLVVPMPILERMARRLSWRETQTLGILARNLWDSPAIQQIRCKYDTADEQLPASRFAAAIAGATGANAIDQLEDACNRLGWVWRLSDDTILLTSRSVQFQRNLDLTPVTIRAENQDIVAVIADLARQAGVPLKSEPGVYTLLSEGARKRFGITATNSSVQTVLDRISGATGLKFTVNNEGLLVSAGPTLGSKNVPGQTVTPAVQSGAPDILGKIVVPMANGQFFEIFVRKSDLSPQAAERLLNFRQDAIKQLESEIMNPQPIPPQGQPPQGQAPQGQQPQGQLPQGQQQPVQPLPVQQPQAPAPPPPVQKP